MSQLAKFLYHQEHLGNLQILADGYWRSFFRGLGVLVAYYSLDPLSAAVGLGLSTFHLGTGVSSYALHGRDLTKAQEITDMWGRHRVLWMDS